MEQNEQPTGKYADQFAHPSRHDWQTYAPASLLSHVLGSLGLEDSSAHEQSTLSSLVQALDDPGWQVRTRAVRTLADFGEQAPIELIAARLSDESTAVRVASALTLGRLGRHVPSEPLIAALSDHDWQVRTAAIQALGMLHEQFSTEVFVLPVRDEEAIVRVSAVRALARFGEQGHMDLLIASLHDTNWLVRETAALVLGELGRNAPLEPLMAALQDKNTCVREAAQIALTHSHPEAPMVLLPSPILPSDTQPTDHVFGVPEQAHRYQEIEIQSMAQTDRNGQLYQQDRHQAFTVSQEPIPIPSEGVTGTYLSKREQMRSTPRRSRLLQFFNSLAAVLIVGFIIGAALLLFTHRYPNAGSAPVEIPFKPLPIGCFRIPQVFCPHDPFIRVNLSKRIGGYTITIVRGYADANQIIIEYIVMRDTNHKQVFADLSSTLRVQKGSTLRGNGSFGEFDPKKNLGSEAMVFDFDATNIPAEDIKELSLQLIINSISNITDPSAAPTRVTGALPIPVVRNPVTFAFSLPFNSGRVVIRHKTVTVAEISVTLERMVVTPSETRFDVQGKQVTLDDSFSLSDDGKSVDDIDASIGRITDRNGNTIVTIPSTSVILNFGPLFSNHAVCAFTVSAPNGKHSGPWIFHFVVP
jgi:hypothetical protein